MHPKAYLVLGLALVQIPQAIAVPLNYKKTAHVHLPHAHHRLSPYDKCTLVLCGTVLLTCALALIAQSCRISALIVRRTQQWKQEEYHADGTHAMADCGNAKRGIISRYATRYGGIVEQVTEVDGIRKVVLVVNARLPTSEDQDAYADWFRRWCQRQETVSSDVCEGAADEMTPLMGAQQPETPRPLFWKSEPILLTP
ncbi:hypothetical protein HFD88_002900 [Aspergillus terreus]|nr:hypothetical protein HFD88_002900 [Aspergillus terreus]